MIAWLTSDNRLQKDCYQNPRIKFGSEFEGCNKDPESIEVPDSFRTALRKLMEGDEKPFSISMPIGYEFQLGNKSYYIKYDLSDDSYKIGTPRLLISTISNTECIRKFDIKRGIGLAEVIYEQFLIERIHNG